MRHARQCGSQCQSRHRAPSDCSLANSSQGKASCSCATCREGREIFRCCPLPGCHTQKSAIYRPRKASSRQRAWHRCAASAAEIERNRRCEGCWKTFCAPHLSLPKGLNLERGRGVEHVRKRQRKDESSTPWAASAKRVWSRMDFLKPSPNGLYADASEKWLKRWTRS